MVHIENARRVSPALALKIAAPALIPRLATRRLDIELLKDVLAPRHIDEGEVLLLPDGAVIDGDLLLDELAAGNESWPCRGVVAEGALTVNGGILNESGEAGPFFVALGAVRAERIEQTSMTLVAAGPIMVSDHIACNLSCGTLRAYGGLRAPELIISDERLGITGSLDALALVLMDVDAAELLLPDLFYSRGRAGMSPAGNIGRALGERIQAGAQISKPTARRLV